MPGDNRPMQHALRELKKLKNRVQELESSETRHRHLEKMLHEERERAQRYLDIVGAIVVAVGLDRRVTLINKRGCEILGYGVHEIIGKDWYDNFLPEQARPGALQVLERLMADGAPESLSFEGPLLTRDGEERFIAWHVTLLRDSEGRVVGALSSGEDVTEHLKAEQALRDNEERFRRFLSAVTDVIYRYDPNTKQYDFISPSFETQTGHSLEELRADPPALLRRITHPDDWDRLLEQVDRHIRKGPGAGPLFTEYRIIRKDGTVIWVNDRKDFEFAPDGSISRVNGVVRDITAQKTVEQALKESEQRYRRLVELSPDAIVVHSLGKIVFANPAAARLAGATDPQELIGKPIL